MPDRRCQLRSLRMAVVEATVYLLLPDTVLAARAMPRPARRPAVPPCRTPTAAPAAIRSVLGREPRCWPPSLPATEACGPASRSCRVPAGAPAGRYRRPALPAGSSTRHHWRGRHGRATSQRPIQRGRQRSKRLGATPAARGGCRPGRQTVAPGPLTCCSLALQICHPLGATRGAILGCRARRFRMAGVPGAMGCAAIAGSTANSIPNALEAAPPPSKHQVLTHAVTIIRERSVVPSYSTCWEPAPRSHARRTPNLMWVNEILQMPQDRSPLSTARPTPRRPTYAFSVISMLTRETGDTVRRRRSRASLPAPWEWRELHRVER